MIIPKFIKRGDTIAVTAPSAPIRKEEERARFYKAKENLLKAGYKVEFSDSVFGDGDYFGRSGSGEKKAKEFNYYLDKEDVSAIISASGGDFLSEMLGEVDIEKFKSKPKWVQGYSDNTALIYYLTTKCDIASIYGPNFGDFGMCPWGKSVLNNLGILEGETKEEESFPYYQDGFRDKTNIYAGYSEDKKVKWQNLRGAKGDGIVMEGRLIGGCLDVILNILGTPYDGTAGFIDKYGDEGIIWFLESFDLSFENLMEGLWKMKEMGCFKGTRGFIFGRPLFYSRENYDGSLKPSYEEVLIERLGKLNVPIITDADIGHKGPQLVMIEGAKARIESRGNKGKVSYI